MYPCKINFCKFLKNSKHFYYINISKKKKTKKITSKNQSLQSLQFTSYNEYSHRLASAMPERARASALHLAVRRGQFGIPEASAERFRHQNKIKTNRKSENSMEPHPPYIIIRKTKEKIKKTKEGSK